MTDNNISMREAIPEDATFIAKLVNQAAEELPSHLWQKVGGPGCDPWGIGRKKVLDPEKGIFYKNAWIAEINQISCGCLICHILPETQQPVDPDVPSVLQPLFELEKRAVSTRYIYVVSTLKKFQGKGVGSHMLEFAELYAGINGMSLIVSNANNGAKRLYERNGYRVTDSLPMVKNGWENPGTEWLLMIKPNA